MDYDKLVDDLRVACAGNQYNIMGYAALAIETLHAENEELRGKVEDARLEGYAKGLGEISADLARVTAERDAAVADMEALMWFSGEGCRICAHAIEVHRKPYVRLDCDREKGTDCSPKWSGIKED